MTDKEQIKTIIQQYANKSTKNFNKSSVNEGKEALCTKFWDGFSQCANLLLLEVDSLDKGPKFELSQKQKEEIFDEVLNMAEPEFIDDSDLPTFETLEETAKNYMKSQNPPIWGLYHGFVDGGKWMNEELCSEIERRLAYMEFQCHRADTYKELKSLLFYIKNYV